MRRSALAFAAVALAALGFATVAAASPTKPDLELVVNPEGPAAGSAVLLQAYVHFGTKPYQGAQVQFVVAGPNIGPVTIDAKPGEAGYYRAQFTPQATGDFTVTTSVDGQVVSPKPYHFQVQRAAPPEWTTPLAGAIALLAALGLGGLALRLRASSRRPAIATS